MGGKVGISKARPFRPPSMSHFFVELAPAVRALAVLDRRREGFASSLPMHADVLTSLSEAGVYKTVVGAIAAWAVWALPRGVARLSATTGRTRDQSRTSLSASRMT